MLRSQQKKRLKEVIQTAVSDLPMEKLYYLLLLKHEEVLGQNLFYFEENELNNEQIGCLLLEKV